MKFETSYIESEACHNNNNSNKEVLIKPGRLDGGKKDILHTTSKPISKLKASKTPSLNPENHFMSLESKSSYYIIYTESPLKQILQNNSYQKSNSDRQHMMLMRSKSAKIDINEAK